MFLEFSRATADRLNRLMPMREMVRCSMLTATRRSGSYLAD
jgi:hypothetical protein